MSGLLRDSSIKIFLHGLRQLTPCLQTIDKITEPGGSGSPTRVPAEVFPHLPARDVFTIRRDTHIQVTEGRFRPLCRGGAAGLAAGDDIQSFTEYPRVTEAA